LAHSDYPGSIVPKNHQPQRGCIGIVYMDSTLSGLDLFWFVHPA
jgi:hypothetical protein